MYLLQAVYKNFYHNTAKGPHFVIQEHINYPWPFFPPIYILESFSLNNTHK